MADAGGKSFSIVGARGLHDEDTGSGVVGCMLCYERRGICEFAGDLWRENRDTAREGGVLLYSDRYGDDASIVEECIGSHGSFSHRMQSIDRGLAVMLVLFDCGIVHVPKNMYLVSE